MWVSAAGPKLAEVFLRATNRTGPSSGLSFASAHVVDLSGIIQALAVFNTEVERTRQVFLLSKERSTVHLPLAGRIAGGEVAGHQQQLAYAKSFRLQYYIFIYVDPPSYQVLKNLNVITTGILFSIFLRKR